MKKIGLHERFEEGSVYSLIRISQGDAVTDPACSSRTIAFAGFVPIWGGSVLRQHEGQFGIGVNSWGATDDTQA